MKPAISQAATLGTPIDHELDAFAHAGWQAVELWITKIERTLESTTAQRLASAFHDAGLTPCAAAFQGGILGATDPARSEHLEHYKRRLELLQALRVPTLIVVPDHVPRPTPDDLGRLCDHLDEAASLARPFGVTLALEFQKTSTICASLDTALALVEHVAAENLGVCLDLFHFHTGPSKLEDLALLSPPRLAHVQVSDLAGTPRELASDADRVLPGDGDLPTIAILSQLVRIGYEGYLSVEVNNPNFWAIAHDRVAQVARLALVRLLDRPLPARQDAPGGP